jgi:menaquinone C8-methyltransferase
MITQFLRLALAGRFAPFRFKPRRGQAPDLSAPRSGVYVHVPFCDSLCDFCPYFKVGRNSALEEAFLPALLSEIAMAARLNPSKRRIESVYFGGGTPALLGAGLARVMDALRAAFDNSGESGIELRPETVTGEQAKALRGYGFSMASLGAQTFSQSLLDRLGRASGDSRSAERAIEILARESFKTIDVDLIFGIPGQKPLDIASDFAIAARSGAGQISTYPFIDFSYARNREKPLGQGDKRRMLDALLDAAEASGFERDSVWTFKRKDRPRYSSITRDNFAGFGPSATSLSMDSFKINTFSIEAYIESINSGIFPTALAMDFDRRTRMAYWLFWRCYGLDIDGADFRALFGAEIEESFGVALAIGRAIGWLRGDAGRWRLSKAGARAFHRVEQIYTRQYIDKTWRLGRAEPWPAGFCLT